METTAPIITLAWLRENGACLDQVELFERTFGNRVEVTPANISKAHEARLNLAWLAYNRDTQVSILVMLAESPHRGARQGVVCNSETPGHALALMTGDPDDDVRRGVAFNHNTPAHALAQMINDSDVHVRRGLTCNPNTPKTTLVMLAADPNEGIRHLASARLCAP
jgi:hypothetical protein